MLESTFLISYWQKVKLDNQLCTLGIYDLEGRLKIS